MQQKYKFIFFFFSFSLLFLLNINAQQCPDNLSFDANNFSFWRLQSGTYSSGGVTYNNTFNQTPTRLVT
jgi:hypothetical protein